MKLLGLSLAILATACSLKAENTQKAESQTTLLKQQEKDLHTELLKLQAHARHTLRHNLAGAAKTLGCALELAFIGYSLLGVYKGCVELSRDVDDAAVPGEPALYNILAHVAVAIGFTQLAMQLAKSAKDSFAKASEQPAVEVSN